jgi:hypothetical protein
VTSVKRAPACNGAIAWRNALLAIATLIVLAPIDALEAQLSAEGSVTVARVEHRVDAGYGVAASTGTAIGFAIRAVGWDFLELDAHASGGLLHGDTVARADRTMGEMGLRLSMLPLPWLAVGAVAKVRGYEAPLGTQRWTMAGGGAEVRLDFAGGGVRSVFGMALLPAVGISGQAGPDLAVSTLAGLHFRRGRLLAGMDYTIERYVFPAAAGGDARHEQLQGLRARFGASW